MANSKHQGNGNSSRNSDRSDNEGRNELNVSGRSFHTQLILNPPNHSVLFTVQQERQPNIVVDVKPNVRSVKGTTSSTDTGQLELPLASEMPAKPPEYTKLMLDVARQIESTPDGLMDFRNTSHAQGHVRAFDLDKKRAWDIIQNLQKKMIVHPGQFEKFVEFLEIIGREDVIKMLPGYQDYDSKDGGNINQPHYNTILEKDETKSGTSLSAVAGKVTDIEISILSDSIPPDCVLRLGIFLDIPVPEIQRQCGRPGGTSSMLFHWRKNVPERDQRQQLQHALEKARLGYLVTDCFGDGKNSTRKDTGPLSRSSIISDKNLSKLAGKIGEGWSQFGIQHLDMSKVDIDHFKHNRSTMEDTIFDMLYEWRQRHNGDATIGTLLDLMEESPNISLDSYNFILEELQSSDLHQ